MTPSPCLPARSLRGWTRRPASSSGTRSSRATRSRRGSSAPGEINEPALSPDGSSLVYATWDDGLGNGGNQRVFEIDTGADLHEAQRVIETNMSMGW